MRTAEVVLLVLAVSLSALAQVSPPGTLVLKNVTVIDATGAPPQPGMTVVIAGDRITAVQKARKARVPKGARVVDAKGKFLLPGLWDMHVHLIMGGEESLPLFLANGVTSVRDMGGDFAVLKKWREQVAAGTLVGPRIKTAGPILESPRFLQILEYLATQLEPPFGDLLQQVIATRRALPGAEAAESVVQALAVEGVDFLKVRSAASPEDFFALAAAAKRAHLRLTGHAPEVVSLAEASKVELGSLEHVLIVSPTPPEFTAKDWEAISARFVEHGTWLDPTLIADQTTRLTPDATVAAMIEDTAGALDPRRRYVPTRLVDFWRLHRRLDQFEGPLDWAAIHRAGVEHFRALHRGGVGFLAGTDFGARLIYPGFSLHDELQLLVKEIGLTPMEALQSATLNPARFFGLEDSLGTIAPGKIADLLLLDANPLEDIGNTKKIAAVVVAGKFLDRPALDALLAQAEKVGARSH